MQRLLFLLLLLFVIHFTIAAQNKILIADFEVVNGDTIFLSDLPEIEILEFKNLEERKKYFILKRQVIKVYPYAIIAKDKLEHINATLDTIPRKRKRKRYTREVTKWIKEEYSDRLKNLTMNEGKILVKLIYRETNKTSFEIVRAYRGVFNAFFWQTMAKIWDNNLKSKYDPANVREDMLIEHILIQAKLEGGRE